MMANVAMLLGYALVRQPPLTPLQLAGSLQRHDAISSRARESWPSRPCRDSAPPRRDKTPQWSSAYLDRRIGRASTPGYRWELVGFRAWRPLLANYRKPAPVFVKQRLKLTACANRAGMPGRSGCQELTSSADVAEPASVRLRRLIESARTLPPLPSRRVAWLNFKERPKQR